MAMEPFLLDVGGSPRFCVHWPPAPEAKHRGAVLFVHPFAEEMNKSRRVVALQARRFAAVGWAVLQIDLLGCGDSAGDFEDARLESWTADLDAAAAWLIGRHGSNLVAWGLRLGASLVLAWVAKSVHRDRISRYLLWQPVASGARHLDQFLRIAVAADRTIGQGSGGLTVAALRRRLGGGETVEVGGYRLSPDLAAAIDALRLDAVPVPSLPVTWIDVLAGEDATPRADTRRIVDSWRRSGAQIDITCIHGEPFWGTGEIVVPEALLRATSQVLTEC